MTACTANNKQLSTCQPPKFLVNAAYFFLGGGGGGWGLREAGIALNNGL